MVHNEKGEKSEKGDEKSEKGEDKWQKDPLSGVFVGLILITIGITYIGKSYLPDPDFWWAWSLVGIGMVSILDAAVRSTRPEWKRPVLGKIVLGIILIAVGVGFIYEIEEVWPYVLIAVGFVILIYYIGKSTRSNQQIYRE
jgi:hypothetical protein